MNSLDLAALGPHGAEVRRAEAPGRRVLPAELRGVRVVRGERTLLDDLDLRIDGGGVTVVMGPNGAGKSLTLRVLSGLVAPDAGEVRLGGAPASDALWRAVAMVFQRPVLLRRTVRGNLGHALRIARVPRRARAARLDELLSLGGLDALAGAQAQSISAGEQQRLALVRALAASPSLLLLDEPTANLDPRATRDHEALTRMAASGGCKVVLVTHDAGQARRMADEVVFLHQGRVVETGPATSFFDAPRTAAARHYLSGDLIF